MKTKKIHLRSASRTVALEPRLLFDGAGAVAAADGMDAFDDIFTDSTPQETRADIEEHSSELFLPGLENSVLDLADNAASFKLELQEAGAMAQQQLQAWVNSAEFLEQAAQIFSADAGSAEWQAQLDSLRSDILNGNYSIRTEVRSSEELNGTRAAYSALGTTGQPTIYLNAQWLTDASSADISAVLLQEFGHDIDNRLNSGADSQGDEGAAFASLLTTGNANLEVHGQSDDRTEITLDGQQVQVEHAGPYTIAQTFYVPMPEGQISDGIQNIYSGTGNTIESIIAITATSKNTYVIYDHWEGSEGYESDPANPVQASTWVWHFDENGNWQTIKAGGGSASAVTFEGNSIILRNQVNKNNPQVVDFDGRDRISSTKAIAVTRAAWDTKIGTIVGGAVNVIDVGNSGSEYIVPVGSSTISQGGVGAAPPSNNFQRTTLYIMAYEDNTIVRIDLGGSGNQGGIIERTLMKGESLFVKGLNPNSSVVNRDSGNPAATINGGTRITATNADGEEVNIGVNLLAGRGSSENRWFSIAPEESWGNSYYAPVATVSGANSHVYLFNGTDNPITVNYEMGNGTTGSVEVAAGKSKYVVMPASAAHFYTAGGEKFYAVATVDPTTTRDWSYSLVAERALTDKFVVAWGPGNGNNDPTTEKNGSPVWVTAVGDTKLYVDSTTVELRDAQNNLVTGVEKTIDGRQVTEFSIDRLQSYRLRDTSDNNQTGLIVYTLDGTFITGAWGQDASVSGTGSPYLDMGTTITPFPDYVITKSSKEASTNEHGADVSNDNTVIEAGEQVEYRVGIENRAVTQLYNIQITDEITPAGAAEYVPNSTVLTLYDDTGKIVWQIKGTEILDADGNKIADAPVGMDLTGNEFPLKSPGYVVADLDPTKPGNQGLPIGYSLVFTYRVKAVDTIDKTLADADYAITNTVKVNASSNPEDPGDLDVEKNKEHKTPLEGITDGEVSFTDGAGNQVTGYEPGQTIHLQVKDGDQNRNSNSQETVKAILTNLTTGQSVEVELTETEDGSGIFTADVNTVRGVGNASDTGAFKIMRGDQVSVQYVDPVTGGTGTYDSVTNSWTWDTEGTDNPENWGINGPNYQVGENSNVQVITIDDSGISVNDIQVNEASPYGVFTVQGVKGQKVKLELPGTGTADKGADYQDTLQYYDVDAKEWKDYTAGDYIEIASDDGTLLVRNPIVNDDVYEGPETYELKVTPKKLDGNDGSSVTGTATIFDDGSGNIWPKDPADPNKPVYEDEPGKTDENAPKDHDRFPMVDNPVVNEATGKVVFTITTQPNEKIVKLDVAEGTAKGGTTSPDDGTVDYRTDEFQYSTDGGTTWTGFTPGETLDITSSGTVLVRTTVVDDDEYEQSETFTLTAHTGTGGKATGTATIKDDGTGDLQDPDDPNLGPKDDDRIDPAITVNVDNPVVNEASGYVVFTVKNTDDINSVGVALALRDGTAKNSQTGPDVGDSDKDYYADSFEYWDGAKWVEYDSSVGVTILADGELEVRVKIWNDTVYEGAETFFLDVTPDGGDAVTGTATILDDGTGTIWVPEDSNDPGKPKDQDDPNKPGDPEDKLIPIQPGDDVPNLPFNDDRTPYVSNPVVNEGTEYVVFKVTTVANEVLSDLKFVNGSATSGDVDSAPKDGSVDYDQALEYSTDGGTSWQTYDTGDEVKVPTGTLLVRTKVANDDNYEVSENFSLQVTVKSDGKIASGVATILDDGTGDIQNPNTGEPLNPGDSGYPAEGKDDDRPVTVNNPTVNEGSPYIVFEVGGITGTPITSLQLGDDSTDGAQKATAGADYGTQLQYFDTNTGEWKDWIEGTSTTTIPAGGTLLVRTTIVNDDVFEGSETFTLTAKTQGGKEATGIGTINDDGTGTIWVPAGPNGDNPQYPDNPGDPVGAGEDTDKLIPKVPTDPPANNLEFDDDRKITISNGGKLPETGVFTESYVREGSSHVYFEVTEVAEGELVNLKVGKGDTILAEDGSNIQYSVDGGSTWVDYNGADKRPQAPANGIILVRVDILAEDDEDFEEGTETFTLTATYASNPGKSAEGTGTILDKSTGPQVDIKDENGDGPGNEGHITVHEGGLVGGDPDKPGKATGTITITTDDGVGKVLIGDNDSFELDELKGFTPGKPSDPVDTHKGYIRVTGFEDHEDGTYTLTYEYELHTPQGHDPSEPWLPDEVDIIVIDGAGGETATSLIVRIVDDEPLARNDKNDLLQVTPSVSGNVMDNDYHGGDTSTVTGIQAGSGTDDVTGNVDTRIKTEYGWITVKPDGSYVYELDRTDPRVVTLTDGSTLQDSVTYTITDTDGDTSTAVLTITINPEKPGTTVMPPPTDPVPTSPLYDPTRGGNGSPLTGSPVITDPSVYFHGEAHDKVIRLPVPMHPVVYVNNEVSATQALRNSHDQRASSNPDAVRPYQPQSRSLAAGLGMDPNLFVSHAVHDSQSLADELEGRAAGRLARTGLSADDLLATPELRQGDAKKLVTAAELMPQAEPAWIQREAVAEGGDEELEMDGELLSMHSAGGAAPSFSEQLRGGGKRLPMAARDKNFLTN